jgi:hypothetical protein
MMLPPGGFFMIGVLVLGANWRDLRAKARAAAARAAAARSDATPRVKEPEREAALV